MFRTYLTAGLLIFNRMLNTKKKKINQKKIFEKTKKQKKKKKIRGNHKGIIMRFNSRLGRIIH